jgi:hypothetical protein
MPTDERRPFIGSLDFFSLFDPEVPWYGYKNIQVFKLYGEWVAYHASDEELQRAVEGIRRMGLALAVEAGPLNSTGECGQSIEGFAGIEEGKLIARRILKAGGRIDLIAMDEPYYFGHFYDGPNACRWTDEKVASEIDQFITVMRGFFPGLIVGDTEPISGPAGAPEYQAWMVSFRAVTGYDLAFLHLDIDWSRPEWPSEALQIEKFGEERGVPVGIIYTGNFQDANDQNWVSICGERIKRYELENNAHPAHVIFQSWHDKPDYVLPEEDPNTFTGIMLSYFTDKTSLGFAQKGQGANLAFRKPVRFSSAIPGYPGEMAVDGDPGTLWNSGAGPVQWLEIDLGAEYSIQSIRLVLSQFPSGMTVHRIRGRTSVRDAPYVTLHTFEGITEESEPLFFEPEKPWVGIRFIRIETLQTPSWIAWREIEVIDSGGQ